MRFPQKLDPNGTIGFVAPSFGCATEPYKTAFDSALYKWEKAGYQVKLGPNCYASEGIGISSTPKKCGDELTEGYCDDKSDVLISCGGGELMCETLSYVDFERVKSASPKWYMGYSDNTNFTFLLNTICDVASIYGPCASTFGMEDEHKSLIDAFKILTTDEESVTFTGYGRWEMEGIKDAEHPLAGYNLDRESVVRFFNGSQMKGRLIGGCLDCLSVLCGTRFDKVKEFNKKYASDGIIWFLEACDLNVMSMRRAMWEFEEAGWFENASGFIIGRPLHFGEEMMGLDQYGAILDVISHYDVPVFMDVDIGHLPPMVPIISGSYATVTASDNNWTITMEKK